MSKAYDRLEWNFLYAMMRKMGFCDKWINLIRICISSVDYSVLFEGNELGPILPNRIIRQGDPLSPYLFIIAMEGFSAMLREYEEADVFHGISIARGAPTISHLLFADDAFLFFEANEKECLAIKNVLSEFSATSGQLVNFNKSTIDFSKNVTQDDKEWFMRIIEVENDNRGKHYLGLPSLVGKKKREVLSYIRERIVSHINNWNNRFLSRAGKEVLLKNVIQAVPTYAMLFTP